MKKVNAVYHFFLQALYIYNLLQIVFITSSGAWKLGGFGHAVSVDQISGDPNAAQPFHYSVSEMCFKLEFPNSILSWISIKYKL